MNGGLEGRYVKYTRVGAYVEGDMGSGMGDEGDKTKRNKKYKGLI